MNKIVPALFLLAMAGCNSSGQKSKSAKSEVKLVTLDPGHFHASLVQKTMYPNVDSTVYVYAPEGADLQLHLDRINGYNKRAENPTTWKEEVYSGDDFMEKMLQQKNGNVVVMAGNNRKK